MWKCINKQTGAEVKVGDCITFEGKCVEVICLHPPMRDGGMGNVRTDAGVRRSDDYGLQFISTGD